MLTCVHATARSMFIQTESTPNEDSLKFLPGQQVMESGTAEFLDTRASMCVCASLSG
jgi:hypothetical protein